MHSQTKKAIFIYWLVSASRLISRLSVRVALIIDT
jgi:hypothetical protein